MKAMTLLIPAVLFAGQALAASGADLYKTNCSACHGPAGKGMTTPLPVPPLAGHMKDVLAAKAPGRAYAISALLYGLQGSVKIKGKTYNSVMAPFGTLSDADLATVLNYVSTSWGNAFPAGQKPFTAAEVTKLRAKTITPDAVLKSRPVIK